MDRVEREFERERERERELERELERERELALELEPERELARELEPERELERDLELERERERDREQNHPKTRAPKARCVAPSKSCRWGGGCVVRAWWGMVDSADPQGHRAESWHRHGEHEVTRTR